MQRAARERRQTVARWRLHNWRNHRDQEVVCICDKQPNRFRKRHASGCLVAHCGLCHGEKHRQIPTHTQNKANLSWLEWRNNV